MEMVIFEIRIYFLFLCHVIDISYCFNARLSKSHRVDWRHSNCIVCGCDSWTAGGSSGLTVDTSECL